MELTCKTKESKIMRPVPQDLLKEYVQSQKFTSTSEIMQAMKEMFCDVIKTVWKMTALKSKNFRQIIGIFPHFRLKL